MKIRRGLWGWKSRTRFNRIHFKDTKISPNLPYPSLHSHNLIWRDYLPNCWINFKWLNHSLPRHEDWGQIVTSTATRRTSTENIPSIWSRGKPCIYKLLLKTYYHNEHETEIRHRFLSKIKRCFWHVPREQLNRTKLKWINDENSRETENIDPVRSLFHIYPQLTKFSFSNDTVFAPITVTVV